MIDESSQTRRIRFGQIRETQGENVAHGTCLCGSLQYEITQPFNFMAHCHCSRCRRHHGAPFATFVGAPLAAFRWISGAENVGEYPSEHGGTRRFCRTCGSVAPLLIEPIGMAMLAAGNIVEDTEIRPQFHIFAGSKAPWFEITDDLPQHEANPPEFGGGTGIERPAVDPAARTGTCLCGSVEYTLGEPIRMFNCHCSRCRRARSAAHTTNLFTTLEGFAYTKGRELVADYKVPDAKYFGVAFCATCGGSVARVSDVREVAVIPAGALDFDPGMHPQANIFVDSKAPWYDITDDLPKFSQMPG